MDVLRRAIARAPDERSPLQAQLLAGEALVADTADPLDVEVQAAERAARKCDLCLMVGSSLVVYPAANIPIIAAQNGARLAIVNATPTPLDELAQVVIREKAGTVLPAAVAGSAP
jgi:NAD-dependent deacetylase